MRLEELYKALLDRNTEYTGETLVPAVHVAQMKLFGIRQGVDFYCEQDSDDRLRKKFIDDLVKKSRLPLTIERLWDVMLLSGELLLYLRPFQDGYQIHYYSKDQFRPYYNAEGQLSEVQVIYNYELVNYVGMPSKRWVKLRITAFEIEQWESDMMLDFDMPVSANSTKVENTLGFLPCVIVSNYSTTIGDRGIPEFNWLRTQVEAHNEMLINIRENIQFFGNPTLISSRSLGELTESGAFDGSPQRPTVTSQSGFYGSSTRSTKRDDPVERNRMPSNGLRVRRVMANVGRDEMAMYISPDPVSGDQNRYAAEYRENLHIALGGVDPTGISSGATAFEVKSIYGRAAATAKQKAERLYTFGLCQIFEMAIAAEEDLFKQSVTAVLGKKELISDDEAFQFFTNGKLPKNAKDMPILGLPPMGDRTVDWRWTGPVFEDSPRDILDKSIVFRNLQEAGIRSIEGFRNMLFPDKSEKELLAMLDGGYPFRYISALTGSAQQLLGLIGQMSQMPDPVNPNMPLAAQFDLLPLLDRTLQAIYQEMSYGKQFDPANNQPGAPGVRTSPAPTDSPSSLPSQSADGLSSPGQRSNGSAVPGSTAAGPGNPAANPEQYSVLARPGTPGSSYAAAGIYPPGPASNGATANQPAQPAGQPWSGQPATGYPDYQNSIPVSGSTIRIDPYATQPAAPSVPNGSTDAAIGTPGVASSVWEQLFPTFTRAVKRKRS